MKRVLPEYTTLEIFIELMQDPDLLNNKCKLKKENFYYKSDAIYKLPPGASEEQKAKYRGFNAVFSDMIPGIKTFNHDNYKLYAGKMKTARVNKIKTAANAWFKKLEKSGRTVLENDFRETFGSVIDNDPITTGYRNIYTKVDDKDLHRKLGQFKREHREEKYKANIKYLDKNIQPIIDKSHCELISIAEKIYNI